MRFDPLEEGKKATYFKMIECIVPRPIAWVSTLSEDGVANIAPFSFFTGVTSSPPTLLFCAGNKRGGVPKDTPTNIIATGEFVVNVVPAHMVEPMVQTSASYDAGVDEFQAAGVTAIPSEIVKVPRVAESPIAFECSLHSVQDIEDGGRVTSRIVVGRIHLIHISDEIIEADGTISLDKFKVVSRLGGQSYGLVGERFDVPRPKV
jgi:flavin reductase (DIM6/NTAB) family NADH-FMN oxidoreductase RutF